MAIQFRNIIEDVFSGAELNTKLVVIDKLEIDLGNIVAAGISSTKVLATFKDMFQQKIHNQSGAGTVKTNGTGSRQLSNLPAEVQHELELLENIIVHGDIPWWADKSDAPDIDSIVQKLLNNNSETFMQLLQLHRSRPKYLLRLFAFIKPRTLSRIEKKVPEFSKNLLQQRSFEEDPDTNAGLLPESLLSNIIKNATRLQPTNDKLRILLVIKLMQFFHGIQLSKLPVSDTHLGKLLLQLNMDALIPAETNMYFNKRLIKKNAVATAVNQLSVFEAELLLFELDNFFDKAAAGLNTVLPDGGAERSLSEAAGGLNTYLDEIDAVFQQSGTSAFVQPEKAQPPFEAASNPDANEADIHTEVKKPESGTASAEIIDKNYPDENSNIFKEKVNEEHAVPNIHSKENAVQDEQSGNNSNEDAYKEAGRVTDKSIAALVLKDVSTESVDSGSVYPDAPDNNTQLYHRDKMVSFIMRRMKSSSMVIGRYLQQLDEVSLQRLTSIFKKRNNQKNEYNRVIKNLLEHPALLEKDILKVFVSFELYAAHKPAQHATKIEKIQLRRENKKSVIPVITTLQESVFFTVLKHLSDSDIAALKDILTKKYCNTSWEKSLLKKVLSALPQKVVYVSKYLCEYAGTASGKMQLSRSSGTVSEKNAADLFSYPFFEKKESQHIQVENAGLCLIAVYLPGFFKELGYLQEGKFKSKNHAARAIFLLQWIVTGKTARPEFLLQLNKLLCGIDIEEPVVSSVRLTKKERQEADLLIVSIIKNWAAVKNTSVKGFRESFLQRKGILVESSLYWTLMVEKKGFDMLLDTLPWSFKLTKLTWMKKMMQAEW